MFKIDRNPLPNYVMDIFPSKSVNASNYFTRNAQNEIFICSTVDNEWNAYSSDVHESDSIGIFKREIHVSGIYQNVITCRTRPDFF